jgi:hypothetical protein
VQPLNLGWTHHAEQRLREWNRRTGVTRDEVDEAVRNPTQTVTGDLGAMVAQVKYGAGLLRVVFIDHDGERRILTLYWTSQVERYWRE